jgi:ubiquinone/menaquinone biosynthesis C-methylase UbiE
MDIPKLYATVQFEPTLARTELTDAERFVIDQFLDRQAATLEAGTGAGRISLALQEMGFKEIAAFDIVPPLIEAARTRDADGSIDFDVQDATELRYADGHFDQIVYLEQFISMMDSVGAVERVLREAHRVLRPGGTALFSALFIESRELNVLFRGFSSYIRILRRCKRSNLEGQSLPWFRVGQRPHPQAFLDMPPYAYWFRLEQFYGLLRDAGFRLRAAGTVSQLDRGELQEDYRSLHWTAADTRLYAVCMK